MMVPEVIILKYKFKDMNIFRKTRFIIGIIFLVFAFFMQIKLFLNPKLIFGIVKGLIKVNPELINLLKIDLNQLIDNTFAVFYFILGWLFTFILLGFLVFIQHNKVKENITKSILGIIGTLMFSISVPIGIFLTLSPDQYSYLTTILGSILVIYGIQKYILKPLFKLLINEIFDKQISQNTTNKVRTAKHFRPPRKRRR